MGLSWFAVLATTALFIVLMHSLAANAEPRIALSGTAGSLGLGADATTAIEPWLNARASAHWLSFDTGLDVGGLDYDSTIRLANLGAYADIYPFPGKARLSLGVLYNDNKVRLHKSCTYGCTAEGVTVAGPNVELDGAVTFNTLAPYAGIGWGNAMSGAPFFILFDAGVMFQGTPKVDLGASGTATLIMRDVSVQNMDMRNSAWSQAVLDYERDQIVDDVHGYRYFPVVSLSMGWRF
jgi:hypothetical protein